MWGPKFCPPTSLFLPFSLFCFILTNFSPSINTIHLLHFTLSSHKKHFSKLLNFPSSISINISLDPCVFEHFHHTSIFGETHFSIASRWLLPPRDPLLLLFIVRNMIPHLIGMMRMGFFKTLGPMPHIVM